MFRIDGLGDSTCVLCDKKRTCFVATCEKGTFEAKPVCSRCLERQIQLRQPNGSTSPGTPAVAPSQQFEVIP
jgi:hypothetical protein